MKGALVLATLAHAPLLGLAANTRGATSMRGRIGDGGCTQTSCPPGSLKEEVGGDAEKYCKLREKKGTHKGGNLWLFCGCSIKKGLIKPSDADDPKARCMKPDEPDSLRKDCVYSETASTDNPDGVETYCVPKDSGGSTGGEITDDGSNPDAVLAEEEAAAEAAALVTPGSAKDPAAPKESCDTAAQTALSSHAEN